MSKVVGFTGTTVNDVPVENVLQGALDADLGSVIVLGWTQEGEFYAAGSDGSNAEAAFLAQRFVQFIHQQAVDDMLRRPSE